MADVTLASVLRSKARVAQNPGSLLHAPSRIALRFIRATTYVFGNKVLMEMQDLENALNEVEASGDKGLAAKIRKELAVREREASAMIDEHQKETPP